MTQIGAHSDQSPANSDLPVAFKAALRTLNMNAAVAVGALRGYLWAVNGQRVPFPKPDRRQRSAGSGRR